MPVPAGANLCWAYGTALDSIGAAADPTTLFPEEELLAVEASGPLSGRRPRSAGLLQALSYGPWLEAGCCIEAIIPATYVEGPLWGIADGFGIPASVFGGWGFSSGRSAERRRRKALKAKRKAERKAERDQRKLRRLALAGGGAPNGATARELAEVLRESVADGGEDMETKEGEGSASHPDDEETPGDVGQPQDVVEESDVPVGTLISDSNGQPLLVKVQSRQAAAPSPAGYGGSSELPSFSVWRNIPLHAAVLDGRLKTVVRSAEAEGGRSADDVAIIHRAAETGGLMVTNDLYREHRRARKAAGAKRRPRRVGYEFIPDGLQLTFHPQSLGHQ